MDSLLNGNMADVTHKPYEYTSRHFMWIKIVEQTKKGKSKEKGDEKNRQLHSGVSFSYILRVLNDRWEQKKNENKI